MSIPLSSSCIFNQLFFFFFFLFRRQSQSPTVQHDQRMYQIFFSGTEVLCLWQAHKRQTFIAPNWKCSRKPTGTEFPGWIRKILFLHLHQRQDQDSERGSHCHRKSWVSLVPSMSLWFRTCEAAAILLWSWTFLFAHVKEYGEINVHITHACSILELSVHEKSSTSHTTNTMRWQTEICQVTWGSWKRVSVWLYGLWHQLEHSRPRDPCSWRNQFQHTKPDRHTAYVTLLCPWNVSIMLFHVLYSVFKFLMVIFIAWTWLFTWNLVSQKVKCTFSFKPTFIRFIWKNSLSKKPWNLIFIITDYFWWIKFKNYKGKKLILLSRYWFQECMKWEQKIWEM